MTAAKPLTRVILEAQLNSLGDLVSSDFAHDVQPEIGSRRDASRRDDVPVLACANPHSKNRAKSELLESVRQPDGAKSGFGISMAYTASAKHSHSLICRCASS